MGENHEKEENKKETKISENQKKKKKNHKRKGYEKMGDIQEDLFHIKNLEKFTFKVKTVGERPWYNFWSPSDAIIEYKSTLTLIRNSHYFELNQIAATYDSYKEVPSMSIYSEDCMESEASDYIECKNHDGKKFYILCGKNCHYIMV